MSVVLELVDALNNLLAETVDRALEVGHELDAAQDEARTKAIAAIEKATGGAP